MLCLTQVAHAPVSKSQQFFDLLIVILAGIWGEVRAVIFGMNVTIGMPLRFLAVGPQTESLNRVYKGQKKPVGLMVNFSWTTFIRGLRGSYRGFSCLLDEEFQR